MTEETLLKYLQGKASIEELQDIEGWILESEENRDSFFEIEQLWRSGQEVKCSQQERLDRSYSRFVSKHIYTTDQKSRKISLPQWMFYAASIVLIAVLSITIYENTTNTEVSYTNFEVPRGQRAKLTLNDGSVVWLNAESKLTYSNNFGKDSRHVKLEGEAFFEVAKNSKYPFVVSSKDLNIKVLGTKFNVEAYYKDLRATVSLISGSVQVENKLKKQIEHLLPNQELVYEDGHMILYTNRSTELSSSWVDGELYFNNESLSKIVKSLERRFDITIIVENKMLEQTKFTCRVRQNANVTDVLELLKKTRKLSYREENSKIIIQ